nr:MAG TPA: Repressor protein CI [Caudoviricetes sp.]
MFYDKFVSLCAQTGVSPTQVAKNIGLSNAAATGWKNGKKPNDITLRRLSDYFSVPVEDLKDEPSAFYENYVRLCNSVGKSPSAVAIELKLGKPSVSRWKTGTKPRDATVLKVANYFGVTVEELMSGDPSAGIKKGPILGDEAEDSETAELRDIWSSADESERRDLLEMARMLKNRRKQNG